MELPANYTPKAGAESWYRHAQTGDRGYVVRRDGVQYIRLDRSAQEILRRLDESWIEEDATRPITPIHVARVCFEADKALCAALGIVDKSREDWVKLSDLQRQLWITQGPKKPHQRATLYATLKGHLEQYCGGH